MECQVCLKNFECSSSKYDSCQCPHCGALYEYDENCFLQLGQVVKYDPVTN
jgi:hypothetical protein